MDFAALPPEINSGLMYTGAGAGPFMAAATAWSNLAAELSSTAAQFGSIITTLTTEQWTGAGSAAAAAAAQPYVEWLTSAAAAAEQAGAQSTASAAAYESAFTATVPPPVIAANRAQLAALVATNFLGINTPAIMATEAQYAAMWVQDAVAMYTYQAGAAAAAVLDPLQPAQPTTNPGGPSAQAAAASSAAASQPAQSFEEFFTALITGLQNEIANFGTQSIGTGLFQALPTEVQDFLNAADGLIGTPLLFNGVQQIGVTGAWVATAAISNGVLGVHTAAGLAATAAEGAEGAAVAAEGAAAGLAGDVSAAGGAASLGEASLVGSLSVPASWSSAVPATVSGASALEGSGWTVAEEAASPGVMAGMPGMAAAAKGAGAYAGPRYGVKPIVMPKHVVV